MCPPALSPKDIEHADLEALEYALIERLLAQGGSSAKIKIVALGGRLFLDGVAGSYREKLLAEDICATLAPNIPTVNRLRVVPDVSSQPSQTQQTNLHAN